MNAARDRDTRDAIYERTLASLRDVVRDVDAPRELADQALEDVHLLTAARVRPLVDGSQASCGTDHPEPPTLDQALPRAREALAIVRDPSQPAARRDAAHREARAAVALVSGSLESTPSQRTEARALARQITLATLSRIDEGR